MEVWKDIEGYEGLYQVSNLGRVLSLARTRKNRWGQDVPVLERILTPRINDKGYLRVALSKDDVSKDFFIHRLVAMAFIPNPNNYPIINHMNEVKTDNRVENLEWCTHKYNVNYGSWAEKQSRAQRGKKRPPESVRRRAEKKKKPIIGTSLLTGETRYFKSAVDAGRELGLWDASITAVIRGRLKTTGNWTFIYANSEEKEATND